MAPARDVRGCGRALKIGPAEPRIYWTHRPLNKGNEMDDRGMGMFGRMSSNGRHDGRPQETGWDRFRSLLNDEYDWPADYTFKFIVPVGQLDRVEAVFPTDERTVRSSKRGRYCSVTVTREVASAEEVIAVYDEAGSIDGIVSL